MTAALGCLPPVEPRTAAPSPFWAALIDPASQPTAIPGAAYGADPCIAGAAAATTDRSLTVTGEVAPASVDVAFADLTTTGTTVDGRTGMLAAIALRGGGILAVLTRCHHQPAPGGALVDPTGAIVAAAQNADLLYLQHIVIPTGPLKPPRPHPTVSAPKPPDRDEPDAHDSHDITHLDLLSSPNPTAPVSSPAASMTKNGMIYRLRVIRSLRRSARDDRSRKPGSGGGNGVG